MITKKGQGISINMIVIAAIALLVLVVMAILVARSGSNFSDSSKCISKGGLCKTQCQTGGDYIIADQGVMCKSAQDYCCSPIERS